MAIVRYKRGGKCMSLSFVDYPQLKTGNSATTREKEVEGLRSKFRALS
jgi:hypothetical protein